MAKTSQLNTLDTLAQDDLIQVVDVSDTTTMTGGGGTNKKITLATLSTGLTSLGTLQPLIPTGTSAQYYRGDKQWATLNKAAVELSNVTNESKTTMFTNPTFTGTVTLPSTTSIGDVSNVELGYLNGVTSNIQTQLDGKLSASVSSTELGYLVGVTSGIQTQLNGKQATITGGASTITGTNLTTNRALVSDASGKVAVSSVTGTELGRLVGVTSSIQSQLDGKQATITGGASTITSANLTTNRVLVSDASGKVAVSSVTGTELGRLVGVTSSIQSQLDGKEGTITGGASTITDTNLTASRALISDASGKVIVSSVTSTELGYLDGVTSGIQSQLNGKQNTLSNATTTVAGLMSPTDKTRLDDASSTNGIIRCNGSGNFSVATITNSDISTTAEISPSKIGAGTLASDVLVANSSITAPKLSGAQTGTAPVYGIRAYARVQGNGAVDINKGFSSISRGGTGFYDLTLTTAPSAGSVPVITATCHTEYGNAYNLSAAVQINSSTSFTVKTGHEDFQSLNDVAFSIMVIY